MNVSLHERTVLLEYTVRDTLDGDTVLRAVRRRQTGRKPLSRPLYGEDGGCDVWGTLTSMRSLCGEPVCLWLPPEQRAPGTLSLIHI